MQNNGELPKYLVEDAHEAIIDRDTFQKVQELIAQRQSKFSHTGSKKRYPLSGMIQCGCCGKNYQRKVFKQGSAWICATFARRGKKYCPAAKQIPEKNIILNKGFCHVHVSMTADNLKAIKEKYPKALVLAHPECKQEVLDLADYIGSTSGIINYATESDNEEFIICTESGVGYELRTKNPNKKFYFAGTKHFCPNMKLNTVEKVCHVLKTGENEVHVSDETRLKSLVPLDKMLEMAK